MAYRAMDAEAQEYAHRLREAGVTDVAIAKEMGISARTLNRTLGPRRVQSAKAAKASNRKVREWPTEREWPAEWSADHLVASRVRDRDTAERVLFVVLGAQRQGNRWVPWFLTERFRIDYAELTKPEVGRLPFDLMGVAWRDLLAGLPVLREWLRCPEATQLRDLVREWQPFTLGVPRSSRNPLRMLKLAADDARRLADARRGYASASRSAVSAIRRAAELMAYETAIGVDSNDRGGPHAALAELLRRLPMVDRPGLRGLIPKRRPALSQVFINIFRFEPSGLERGQS